MRPIVVHAAVGGGHVGKALVVQNHPRHHGKGYVDLLRLAAYQPLLKKPVVIVEADHYPSALPRQLVRGNGPAIQRVGNAHRYGRLLFRDALGVDVAAQSVPDPGVSADGAGPVPLHVFHILQTGGISELGQSLRIFQPVADDDLLHRSVRSRQDVHRLVPEGGGPRRRYRSGSFP